MNSSLKEAPAQEAFFGADFERALALLHNDRSPGATYLRVRAIFRLGKFTRAIAEAEKVDLDSLVHEEVVALLSLHAFVLIRLGRYAEARSRISTLEGTRSESPYDFLEVQCIKSYYYYFVRRYERCFAAIQSILANTENLRDDRRQYAFERDAYSYRAQAATLLGIIHGSRAQFALAQKWHAEALLSAERSVPRDNFFEAHALANLSCAITAVNCPSSISILRDRLASLKWSAGIDEQYVNATRNLRHASNVFGSDRIAFTTHAASSSSLAWKLADSVGRLLTQSWPTALEFDEELSYAKTFITRVDWINTTGDEVTGLAELVPLLAPFDVVAALDANSRREMTLALASPHSPLGHAARDTAIDRFASGCIAKASAKWLVAEADLRASFDGLFASGIRWRASIAAIELFTLTREDRLLEVPRDFIAAYPRSPFSKRLGRAVDLAPDAQRGAFPYLKDAIPES
ncbi:MAG: hypothetical protein IAI50_01840 [Candidatus Eremiobacteraeota bacterium]|nr:hypothetical protein [Candidatus Eremiobacteraeota bacterium]